MNHSRCVAIGEVRIDHSKHQDEEERQRQVVYLRRVSGVAGELQKPVVIHYHRPGTAPITQGISAAVHSGKSWRHTTKFRRGNASVETGLRAWK